MDPKNSVDLSYTHHINLIITLHVRLIHVEAVQKKTVLHKLISCKNKETRSEYYVICYLPFATQLPRNHSSVYNLEHSIACDVITYDVYF